jgi:hypothetical protein
MQPVMILVPAPLTPLDAIADAIVLDIEVMLGL